MKVSTATDDVFTPITLAITLESQAEVEELHNILNHTANVFYCQNLSCAAIREALEKATNIRLGTTFNDYRDYLQANIK